MLRFDSLVVWATVIVCTSLQDLGAYWGFLRVEMILSIFHVRLLPPRTQNHPTFELDKAPQLVGPGRFWAFKTHGVQGFDNSGRAFKRSRMLEMREVCRGSRVGTVPTRAPNQKTREVAVAC